MKKEFIFTIVIFLIGYTIIELIFSFLYVYGFINKQTDGWFFEDSGKTILYDKKIGYKLSEIPSKHAKISNGIIEYEGIYVGNKQGFPDKNDFIPDPKDTNKLRYIIFGDSFTSAQFLKINWPERVEKKWNNFENKELELLNFSFDGGGLANWWLALNNIIIEENYNVDGIIFGVFSGDLFRNLTIIDHRNSDKARFIRWDSWDTNDWPKDFKDVENKIKKIRSYIVSKDEYERILNKEYHPEIPRLWRPWFLYSLRDLIFKNKKDQHHIKQKNYLEFNFHQLKIINDFKKFIEEKEIDVYVASIPNKNRIINKLNTESDVIEFSKILKAKFIDGYKAFDHFSPRELNECWLPYDGHWGQKGSDIFADFILKKLKIDKIK